MGFSSPHQVVDIQRPIRVRVKHHIFEKYHFITKEMARQAHYVISKSVCGLSICSVRIECPVLSSFAPGHRQHTTVLGSVTALSASREESDRAHCRLHPSTLIVLGLLASMSSTSNSQKKEELRGLMTGERGTHSTTPFGLIRR